MICFRSCILFVCVVLTLVVSCQYGVDGGVSLNSQEPPHIDLSFLEGEEANQKTLKIRITPETEMTVELFNDLDQDMTSDTVALDDFLGALNTKNPKRLHDIAMLMLQKICETTYAIAVPTGIESLKQVSSQYINVVLDNFKRDYVFLFQGFMFTAVVHQEGDDYFGINVRKAFNLAQAHGDNERREVVVKLIIHLLHSSETSLKIMKILKNQAKIFKDYQLVNYLFNNYVSVRDMPSIYPALVAPSSNLHTLNGLTPPPPYFVALDTVIPGDIPPPPSYSEAIESLCNL
jgi:hypothetical protein